jgi:hypothetical protein
MRRVGSALARSIQCAAGVVLAAGLARGGDPAPAEAVPTHGLLLALSQFEVTAQGKVLPRPKAALLEIVVPRGGAWEVVRLEDPDSNVFHKAMVYAPPTGEPGILTLGGSRAALKLWRKRQGRLVAETLWSEEFGGKHSRMRDAEIGRIGERGHGIAVATHDQGVVALVHPAQGAWTVEELDREPNTFVHEIELGDLDGDGAVEIYATPSEPNLLDGRPQSGRVVRYQPGGRKGREVVADLGDRHAKEILVTDLDRNGRDELYVSIEAVSGGALEIRRYDAGTGPWEGRPIARLEDRLCRFLVAGDIDGDGHDELVAAASKAGLWLIRPPAEAGAAWTTERIDAGSSGFEHAVLLADLDSDGRDELYVASDDQGELRRYRRLDDRWETDVLLRRDVASAVFTWNVMPVPLGLVPVGDQDPEAGRRVR